MTRNSDITNDINNGSQPYICVGCERIWTKEHMAPISYKEERHRIDECEYSSGMCFDCFEKYRLERWFIKKGSEEI